MNPHGKEAWFLHYLEEKQYMKDIWYDSGSWVEVGGLALVICTISINTGDTNVGFRIVDENDRPLPPYRTKNNNRHSIHFSSEPPPASGEDLTPVTFHMIANCQYAKLQVRASDGAFRINSVGLPGRNAIWSHKPISTMTAMPLAPFYQPGANTVFTYPQSRMPRKSPVIHEDKI